MGRQEMLHTTVNLDQLIKNILSDLRLDLQGRAISWTIAALPDVQGDPAMLRQVFMNLIANAVKFTSAENKHRRFRSEWSAPTPRKSSCSSAIMVWDLTCSMLPNCLECSRDCTGQTNLKEPVLAWPMFAGSFIAMGDRPGPKVCQTRERPSTYCSQQGGLTHDRGQTHLARRG